MIVANHIYLLWLVWKFKCLNLSKAMFPYIWYMYIIEPKNNKQPIKLYIKKLLIDNNMVTKAKTDACSVQLAYHFVPDNVFDKEIKQVLESW